jgi:hypothetical protein
VTPLHEVPRGEAELARLYHELARVGGRVEGRRSPWRHGAPGREEVLVLAAQASRHDPRLLWALVELLARAYATFDALALRRAAGRARWPSTLGVVLEFARRAAPGQELDDWAAFVARRLPPPARGERYFLGTRPFGGEAARRDAEESLAEYKRWGYLGREEPFAKELGAAPRGSMERVERLNLLRRLASRRGTVTHAEYAAALHGRVSARQATRDLGAAPFLRRDGRTRAARYRLVPPEAGGQASPRGGSRRGPAPEVILRSGTGRRRPGS